jgi:hypothetical protein
VAVADSVYGIRFTTQNAQAIQIKHPGLLESPTRGLAGLPQNHIRRRNFQFGCQMFEVDDVGDTAKGIVVRTLRHSVPVRLSKG